MISWMICTTHILVQLKVIHGKPEVYESKWIPCWYDHLGHPGSIMMRKKGLKKSCWHPLKSEETSSDQWVFMYYTFTEVDN